MTPAVVTIILVCH